MRIAVNTVPWELMEKRFKQRIGEGIILTLIELLNIFYDEVLGVEMPGGCELVAYADELDVVGADLWMDGIPLKLAPEKT